MPLSLVTGVRWGEGPEEKEELEIVKHDAKVKYLNVPASTALKHVCPEINLRHTAPGLHPPSSHA